MNSKDSLLIRIINAFDRITRSFNKLFTWLAGIMILIITVLIVQDVIRRYFLDDPTAWALDISRFLLVYIVFLSLAPALESGQHVTVDILTEIVSEKAQKYLKMGVFVLTIIFGIIFSWKLLGVVLDAAADNWLFPVQFHMPMKYIYWIAPVGMLQFILTAFDLLLKQIFKMSQNNDTVELDSL